MIKRLVRIIRNEPRASEKRRFSNVFTLLDVDLLRQAFRKLERGQKHQELMDRRWWEYEANLESNLKDLATRLHRQRLIVLTRVFARKFQKGMGRSPIGHSGIEDKLVQTSRSHGT